MYYFALFIDIFINSIIVFVISLSIIAAYHFILRFKKKEQKITAIRKIAIYVFCLALSFIFTITETPDINNFGLSMIKVSFIPISSNNIVQPVLNIILFIPFGFFVPLLWKRFQSIIKIIIAGLFFSLFIELSQLFNYRVTDINDLIMNTIGALTGYLIFRIFQLITSKFIMMFGDDCEKNKSELYIYIAVVFTASFLRPIFN